MRIDGSVVLVTGASSGIGEATAVRLAERGAQLVVHGRDRERLDGVAQRTGAASVLADLTDDTGVAALADQALGVHGHLDAVVHSAGIGWSGRFEQMPDARRNAILQLDLAAPIALTHLLLPHLLRRGRGHLCFVSSIAGRTGVAGEAVYAAAKAGLDGFAESLRLEVAGRGIGVSVVVPGAVDTPFFATRGRPYDRRIPRPQSADAVARAVQGVLESGRAEAFVPVWLRLAQTVRGTAPSVFRRLNGRFGERLPVGPPDVTTPATEKEPE